MTMEIRHTKIYPAKAEPGEKFIAVNVCVKKEKL